MHISNSALVKYFKIFYPLYKHPGVQLSDLVLEECSVMCITLRIITLRIILILLRAFSLFPNLIVKKRSLIAGVPGEKP